MSELFASSGQTNWSANFGIYIYIVYVCVCDETSFVNIIHAQGGLP